MVLHFSCICLCAHVKGAACCGVGHCGRERELPGGAEEFGGELLEMLVGGLKGGEVQGREGLLVGGVAGPLFCTRSS